MYLLGDGPPTLGDAILRAFWTRFAKNQRSASSSPGPSGLPITEGDAVLSHFYRLLPSSRSNPLLCRTSHSLLLSSASSHER
jgi:hypothetical protein